MQSKQTDKEKPFLLILALASIYIIWGTTQLALQVTVATLPPLLSIGSRHLIAGIILLLLAVRSNNRLPHWRDVVLAAPMGLVTMGLCNGIVALVGSRIGAGTITCIFATGPLFIMVLTWLSPGAGGPKVPEVISVITGLGGVIILVACQIDSLMQPETIWMIALILATILWAGTTLWTRKAIKKCSVLYNSALQMLWGGGAGLLTAWLSGDADTVAIESVSLQSLLAYLYLILFGSLIAVTAFNFVLMQKGAMVAASHSYANPVVALLIGNLFAGERLAATGWLGVCLILFAVVAATTGLPINRIFTKLRVPWINSWRAAATE